MYEVVVSFSAYHKWDSFHRWSRTDTDSFRKWLLESYPEILSVEWDIKGTPGKAFTFASEEMYQWFLLRQ